MPEGIPTIDGRGGTLLAGFWNSHVHFLTPGTRTPAAMPADALEASLASMLTRWGFTTVFDISSIGGAAARILLRSRSALRLRQVPFCFGLTAFFQSCLYLKILARLRRAFSPW